MEVPQAFLLVGSARLQVEQTHIRSDESVELLGGDRRFPGFQDSLNEPEVQ